jgi:hypothetical protein
MNKKKFLLCLAVGIITSGLGATSSLPPTPDADLIASADGPGEGREIFPRRSSGGRFRFDPETLAAMEEAAHECALKRAKEALQNLLERVLASKFPDLAAAFLASSLKVGPMGGAQSYGLKTYDLKTALNSVLPNGKTPLVFVAAHPALRDVLIQFGAIPT